MSLTFAQMKELLHEIKPKLEGAVFDHCTASGERKFILNFKEQHSLLICFQEPFLRFHLTKHHWKDHPQPFSKTLTHALQQWHLSDCELFQEDRILLLIFRKGNEIKNLFCEFIPKRANCLLVDSQQQVITSLNLGFQSSYTPPPLPVQQIFTTSEILSSSDIEGVYQPLELQAEFSEKKHHAEMQLRNKLKQTLKAKSKFSQELDAALRWEDLQHEATLIQSNLFKIKRGMDKVSVNDWMKDNAEVEITLDPTIPPADEVAQRFQKSKKLKRGIEPLKRQLDQTHKNTDKISGLLDQLQEITTEEELKIFCQKNYLSPLKADVKRTAKMIPALPYRELITETGLQIWVGKSAKDNDKLTFVHANGSDYWLHAHDVPGSHVVLHLGKHKEPDAESLKDAIQAALFFSKAKDSQEGEVCITQCKYVSRFGKNQPGKVQISHHRVAYAKIDLERLKTLRERKINHRENNKQKFTTE